MVSLGGKASLVLGASGFIGSNLSEALINAGSMVSHFGRTPRNNDMVPGVQWFPGDFNDHAALARAVDGQEVVFHCISATVPGTSNLDITADLQTNVTNTISLLDICRKSGVKMVVFTSSGGTIYGNQTLDKVNEFCLPAPISAYGVSKLAIEHYLHLYNHLYGLNYRIARLSNPFGRFQRAYRKQGLIAAAVESHFKRQVFDVWGDGSVVRDYLPVSDTVAGLLALAEYEGDETTFNLGSGEGRSVNTVLSDLEHVLGGKIERRYVVGKKYDILRNVLDVEKIQRVINWRPSVQWSDALSETCGWLEAEVKRESAR